MKKQILFLSTVVFLFSCNHNTSESKEEKQDSLSIEKMGNPMSSMTMEEKEMKEMAEKQKSEKPKENPYKNSRIDVTTFKNNDGSWGYDISIDGHKSIVQPNIPGLPGNRGFNTFDEAKRTGELAAYKIRNNIMPPTLDKKELDSLGVLK